MPVFEKVGADTGLPAILLASFALQESTCNPNTMGGGGEVGLMQITPDKCGGRSAAACRDPEFNVSLPVSLLPRAFPDLSVPRRSAPLPSTSSASSTTRVARSCVRSARTTA